MMKNSSLVKRISRGIFMMAGLFVFFGLTQSTFAVDETTVEGLIPNEFQGGGVAQGWNDDDGEWAYTLPFTFDFYGVSYTDILISSNGYICMDNEVDCTDYEPYLDDSYYGPLIAPMAIDLTTYENPENDIYITENADNVIIRWSAVEYDEVDNINFEVILYSDGNIKFNYGNQEAPLLTYGAVVGISKGDDVTYTESIYYDTNDFDQVDTSAWGDFGPVISSMVPIDDVSDIATDADLSITFDRNIFEGAGNITIKKTADDSIIETIAASSPQITGWGTQTLTVDPINTLPAGSRIHITIDQGAIKDIDDNNFRGFTDATSWSFATDFEIIEDIPAGECYEVGSAEATQPANTTLTYSNNDKTSWTYTPVDQGNGGDCNVTHIRLAITEDSGTLGEDTDAEFVGVLDQMNIDSNALTLTGTDLLQSFSHTIGSTSYDAGGAVDVNNNNEVFVTGWFGDDMDFDDSDGVDFKTQSVSSDDAFLTKYNADSSYAWTQTIPNGQGYAVYADDSGNVYITGEDMFAKYNSSGAQQWVYTPNIYAYGISGDSSGNIYITGSFSGTIDFDFTAGTDNHTSSGGTDVFVSKYDSNGSYVWTYSLGSTSNDWGKGVSVEGSTGDIFISGTAQGTIDYDGTAGVDNHTLIGRGIFLTKYNADSSYAWTRTFGGSGGNLNAGSKVDSFGHIYVTGTFQETVNFDDTGGTDNHTATAGSYSFLTQYNTDGSYGWTTSFYGSNQELVESGLGDRIDIDSSGNIYLTGVANAAVDFLIKSFDSSGIERWTRVPGGEYAHWTEGYGIAVGSNNSVYVTGYFQEGEPFNLDDTGGTDIHYALGQDDIFVARYNTDGSYPYTNLGPRYPAAGTYQTSVSPADLLTWNNLTISQIIPAEATEIEYTVFDSSCSTPLAGPTTNVTIDISSIPLDQDDLCLQASLTTLDDTVTPALDSWSASYTQESAITTFDYSTITQGASSPPILTSAPITSVLDKTAQGNGNITDVGGEDPMRYIEWGTVSGTYTDSCSAGTGSAGVYSCSMTNLAPETLYYARAYATNAGGTTYGSEVSFTTLPLQDIIIPDPDPTQMQARVTEGYMSIGVGAIDSTSSATTNVNVTMRTAAADIILPTGTNIAQSNREAFDFTDFTVSTVTESVRSQQPTSLKAVQIGTSAVESFSFAVNDATIVFNVGGAFNGQELDILVQEAGSTEWNPHSTPTCTVSEGQCTFTTDHATIYTVNGEHSETGQAPIDINVEVQDTLSLDCYDGAGASDDHTVSLGTTANPGLVTAGTPAVGRSTCEVTTNDDQGYYLTIVNSDPTYEVLTHIDPNTAAVYEIDDVTDYAYGIAPGTTWSAPTTKGLAFSVVDFPDTDTSNNDFDGVWSETDACPEGVAPDTNDYAGIPDTAETIAAVTQYEATTTVTDICYKVDVPPSQASGQYSGEVTYTATTDASSYHN